VPRPKYLITENEDEYLRRDPGPSNRGVELAALDAVDRAYVEGKLGTGLEWEPCRRDNCVNDELHRPGLGCSIRLRGRPRKIVVPEEPEMV
jgi:hypothetical protein